MTKNTNSQKPQIFTNSSGILPKIPNQERYNLIGQITSLMLSSNLHRQYRIDDIGAMFLPAIHLNQFRIYKNQKGDPVALITWAYLSNDIENEYQQGKRSLKLADWKSGDNGWIIDFIAPFGHAKQVIRDLRNNVFPGQIGKALRVKENGKVKGVLRFWGKGVDVGGGENV